MSNDLTYRWVQTAEEWQTILPQLPNAHPLQSWRWGELKAEWGWTTRAVVWEQVQMPVAGALVLTRKLGRVPLHFLYTPKGPLLDWSNQALRERVMRDLQTIAKQDGALFLKIDPDVVQATGVEAEPDPTGQTIMAELTERGWHYSPEQIQFKNTVMLDLTQSEDELLAGMKSKTRYNIRLAAKKGVTVRMANPADFEQIAGLFQQTAERNGFLIRPQAYYLTMWQLFYRDNRLIPLVAEYEGQMLSAVMVLHTDQVAVYKDGASSDQERNRMPAYLVQWEAVRQAQARGCTHYDMWGAPDVFDESDSLWGVWRFKKGWNGTVRHHIGAWDFPASPLLYNLFTSVLPRYRAWLRR